MLALLVETVSRYVRARTPVWLKRRITPLLARTPGSRIRGLVDRPSPGQPFFAWLDVEGWAFSIDGGAVTVEILVKGRPVRTVPASSPRPEVEKLYPSIRGSGVSGFQARLFRKELPQRTRFWVMVKAHVSDTRGYTLDSRTLALIPVRATRVAAPHVRRGYQQAWDHDARTEDRARRAVCGTDDLTEYERSGEATAAHVAEQTRLASADVVLEIGCGTGRVGAKLAPRCAHWIGADVSPRMLQYARAALTHLPNVSFQQLSGVDLEGISDSSIDVAYCTTVFMHLDEWERYRYVTEMYRVLRPRGRVYFDSFNLLGDEGWAAFMKLFQLDPAARPSHISKASTPEELRVYAERAGFQDIRLQAGSLWVWLAAIKPKQ